MRFLRPDLSLWFIPSLAALALLHWRVRRRYVASNAVGWLAAPGYRAAAVRRLPFVLLAAGLLLTGVGLLQPVVPFAEARVEARGLDIVLVLDLSSSMQEPMNPGAIRAGGPAARYRSRLDATKDAIAAFVRARRDDRIGLVVFSDHAYVVAPPTFDREYLTQYVQLVDELVLQGEGQTAIGEGLALAQALLAPRAGSTARGQPVVVLFTDGENNRGRDPVAALAQLEQADVRVHAVGVAFEAALEDAPEARRLVRAIRHFGGQYFSAATERDLARASDAIDRLETGVLAGRTFVRDAPVFHWFAVPALMCVAAAVGLRAIPYFVDET